MAEQKFNQQYYKIHFSDLDDDLTGVVSFEGEEEISNLYEYKIALASLDPKLDSSKILNKPATFTFIRPDESKRDVHGIICNFEQTGRSREFIFYKVVLVPRLWQLNLVFQNEIYQKMEIKDLIPKILEDCGLSGSDFKIDLKSSYPKNEFVVQYRETNLNFLNRRLEHFGIYYYFDNTGDNDVVCFTDDNSKLPAIDASEKLGFNENREPLGTKESIFEFLCREKIVTGAVQLKDYNYMYPEKQLMAQSKIDGKYPGTFYDYGDHFENEKEADFLAKIRSQEIFCQSKIFYGTSDSRLLSSGYKFTLENHYRDDWNNEYIITSITYKGNQHNLFFMQHTSTKDKPYENNFTAIPAGIEFRPARRARYPKISGMMNARIDASGNGKYASIDEHGRYKTILPFDLSGKENGEASHYIRMAQPYSGGNYGMHFPLHKGAEVLLTFIDGNPDRPVISGTVPNPSNASPVKGANQTQSVIRTAAENEIVIEDKGGSELIHINQACGNEILMKAEGPDIEIKQKNGNEILMKAGGPEIDIKQKCGNQIVMKEADGIDIKDKYGNEIKLDAAAGFIHIGSPTHNSILDIGKSIKWSSDSNWEGKTAADEKSITLGNGYTFTAGEKASITVGSSQDAFIGAKMSKFAGFQGSISLTKSYSRTHGTVTTMCSAKETNKAFDKKEEVSGRYDLDVGDYFIATVGGGISLKVGDSKLAIDKESIIISSKKIYLLGSDKIVLSSSLVDIPKGELKHKDTNVT